MPATDLESVRRARERLAHPREWSWGRIAIGGVGLFAAMSIFSDILYYAASQEHSTQTRVLAIVANVLLLASLILSVRWTRACAATGILAMIGSLASGQLPIGLFASAVIFFVAAMRRDRIVGAVIAVTMTLWTAGAIYSRGTTYLADMLWLIGLWVSVATLCGWALGNALRRGTAAERRAADLEAQAAQVRQRERQVLARELHDVVAHGLTLISMQAAVMRVSTEPEQLETARDAIERSSRESLEELKRLLQVLRASEVITDEVTAAADPSDEHVERSDFEALVERLADDLRAVGHTVHVDCEVGQLAHSVQLAADRVLREATTNIVKHAGKGTDCRIAVRDTGETLIIDVANELRSERLTEIGSSRLGVVGLTERVELLGGSLSAGQEGDRWHMHATLPLVS